MCREGAWDELAVGVTSGIAIRSGMLVKKDCIYKKSVLSYVQKKQRNLQGRVRFPTGGKARGPKGMIRCDSGADSIVWMKEDDGTVILIDECSV